MWLQLLATCSLLATALAQSGTVKCGGSWQQLNNKCFLAVSGANKQWHDARTDCQKRSAGGDLVVIPDQATANVLLSMLSGVNIQYWIGLHDITVENSWKWIDDQTTTAKGYSNWTPGEPNDYGFAGEDCATFKPFTPTGEWNDARCNGLKPYICERDVTDLPRCDESKGWRGYNGKCYQFFSNNDPWQTVENRCNFSTFGGGHLAYIKSPEDQAFLDNLQVTHGSSYWIGLQDKEGVTTSGQYLWSDMSSFDAVNDFNRWEQGQPSSQWYGNEGDCGSVTSTGQWTIQKCTDRNSYVCEIPEGTCAPGWFMFNGHCYQVNSQSLRTWTDARRFCEAELAYLIQITSDAENNAVKGILTDLKYSGIDELWIGISDIKQDNTFEWAFDSQPIGSGEYSHWADGQPAGVSGLKECGYIETGDSLNATWMAGDCFMLGAFVCETLVGQKVKSVSPDHVTGSCDDAAWDLHEDQCYEIFQTKKTWTAASSACQALGAKLASIHDDDVQSLMSVRINSLGQRVWIGLNDRTTEGSFVWTDGTSFEYNNWAPGHPAGADCVSIVGWSTNYGLWKTRSCSEMNYYVCQKKSNSAPQPSSAPLPTINYFARCGNGWEYDDKSAKCFVFRPTDHRNWFQARYKCRQEGGDLMSLTSNDDLAYATSRLQTSGQGSSWIGCNDLGTEGGWVWSDKGPFSLINWSPGQPDNWFGVTSIGEHCCEIYHSSGRWNDNFCNVGYLGYSCNRDAFIFKYFFAFTEKKMTATSDLTLYNKWPRECAERCVAETSFTCLSFDYDRGARTCYLRQIDKSAGGGLLPTFDTQHFDYYERDLSVPAPVPPTLPPADMGCPQGWGLYQGYCYFVELTKYDFANAETECQNKGAELASIGDVNVNNFLRGFITTKLGGQNENRYWIGLNDRNQEMLYEWSNGEPVTYTNWNAREPNNANEEDCAELYRHSGFWNDLPCSGYTFNSLCRKPMSTGNPTPTPDTTCPSGWKPWMDRCYLLSSASTKATWANAGTNCENSGGQLVIIEDRIELAYLSGQLGLENGDEFFIGLSDNEANMKGYYQWKDKTTITYTNWGEGQPDNSQGDCVTMSSGRNAGYWKDRDCSQTYRYICEKARSGYPTITTPTNSPATTPTSQDCATGWVGYGNRCFNIFEFSSDNRVTWDTANLRCKNMGAELASFHHPDEEKYLVSQFNPTTNGRFWIGMNDQRYEGGYAWSDGTQVEYTNWNSGEPNDYGGQEECVETNMKGGKWNDLFCWYRRNFVCAIEKGKDLITTPAPTKAPGDPCEGDSTWVHYYPYCYYFSYYYRDWYAAEEYCHDNNGHLASIHNDDERDFIKTRMSYYGGNYWIGLRSNLSHPGVYKWSDYTLFDYEFWLKGQPDTQNGEELCVQLKGKEYASSSEGRWMDANCGTTSRFVCKKNFDDTPVPTHAPTDPPTGNCLTGWTKHKDNRCYKVLGVGDANDPKLNWQDAKQACIDLGANLASIHSFEVQTYLTADLINANDDVWIGMSNLANSGRFLWTDSSSTDFVSWAYNQPDYSSFWNSTECVKMTYEDAEAGKWNNENCAALHSYLCKMNPDDANPDNPVSSDCQALPSKGYVQYGDACFKVFVDQKRTFNESKDKCAADGATLASVLNGFEQAKLLSLMLEADADSNVWLGLYDDPTTGIYSWVDGWPLHYAKWGWGSPSGQGCAVVSKGTWWNDPGDWSDVSCDNTYYTACKYSTGTPPTPYPTVDGYCLEGWSAFGSSCYIVGSSSFATGSFGEAVYDCDKYYGGAHVATIGSKNENSFVNNLATKELNTNWVLIGIERSISGGWEWVDGSPMAYTNWANNEPNDNDNNCAELWPKSQGKWFDIGCKVNSHYVCEKPKIPYITTPGVFNPPQCPTSEDSNWKLMAPYCYYANTNYVSWQDAEAWCNQKGGYLASIHSDEELEFVRQLAPYRYSDYWIGFNKLYDQNAGDDYRWTDMSNPNYTHWDDGQPNDHQNAQKCAHMHAYDGTWEDTNCGVTGPFICKRESGSTTPIVKPTDPPATGNCPDGWYKIETGCYQLKAGKDDSKTWEDARAECQKESGGQLAAIHDQGVQSLLTSLLKSQTGNMWIGLREGTGGWYGYHWVDQSNVDYEFWALNQPSYDSNQCVVMVNDPDYPGRWDDLDCDTKHGYLCYQPLDPSLPTAGPPRGMCAKDGYERYFDDCFKINTTRVTFADAKTTCESEGAALATLIDGYADAFIVAMLYRNDADAAWIGFMADNDTRQFGWVDGWPVSYTNWSPWEPSGDDENCAKVTNRAQWESSDCEGNYAFICRTTTATMPPVTEPPKVPGTCPYNWTAFNDHCYKFDTTNSDYANWYEASYRCKNDHNSRLLAIHTKAENDFVRKNLGDAYYWQGIWLDLTRNETGQGRYTFMWNDKSPLDFTYWKIGEPSVGGSQYNMKDCVVMMPNAYGKWQTKDCSWGSSYACIKPKDYETNPPPEPYTGLGGGAIAGIVIGVLLAVVLAMGLGYILLKNRQAKKPLEDPGLPPTTGFDNVLYTPSVEEVKCDTKTGMTDA